MIGFKKPYFQLIHLQSCFRTVCPTNGSLKVSNSCRLTKRYGLSLFSVSPPTEDRLSLKHLINNSNYLTL